MVWELTCKTYLPIGRYAVLYPCKLWQLEPEGSNPISPTSLDWGSWHGSVEVSLDDDEQNGLEFGSTFMQFDKLESYYQDGKFNLVVKDVVGINFIEYSEFKLNLTSIMQACDKLKVELEKTVK